MLAVRRSKGEGPTFTIGPIAHETVNELNRAYRARLEARNSPIGLELSLYASYRLL
jgi:hypothetical protein